MASTEEIPQGRAPLDGESTESAAEANPTPGSGAQSPGAALGAHAASGLSWTIMSIIASKALTTVVQIALGWKLTKEDMGLFAAANAVASIVTLFRDGGATSQLLQAGASRYKALSGPVFWLGTALMLGCAVFLAATAYPMHYLARNTPENAFADHRVVAMLLIIALAMAMQMPSAMLFTKMRVDLRFIDHSRLQLISAFIRQGLTLALAFAGFGPYALAAPMVLITISDTMMAYRATRDRPWMRSPAVREWPALLSTGKWIVLVGLANMMLDLGPYAVMATLMSQGDVGLFYFAFQITAQMGVLLGTAMQQVLLPIFARLNDEAVRQREATLRVLHAVMIPASYVCIGLSVVIEPFERLLWRGKWAAAVPAIIILGVFFPWRITFGLSYALLQAQGRFKRHAILTTAEGVGLIVATLLACVLTPTVTGAAWWTGGWLFIARISITTYMLRYMGAAWRDVWASLLPAWIFALAAGAATMGLDRWVSFGTRLAVMFAEPESNLALTVSEAVRFFILGTTFSILFVILVRSFLVGSLKDAMRVAPVRMRGLLSRLLFLQV